MLPWLGSRETILLTPEVARLLKRRLVAFLYAIPDDFTVESYLGNAWRMIRGKKRYEVELRFDAAFAETIADTHWHSTQQIDWHEDGSITFRCTVDGLDEIVWWILSMGPHCVVAKPKELAGRVKELATKIVEKYSA